MTRRASLGILAAAVVVATLVLGYPFLLDRVLDGFGVRAVAIGLGALAVASDVLVRPRLAKVARIRGSARLMLFAGIAAAAASADRRVLLLLPALASLAAFDVFRASLADSASIVERGARLLQPRAPEFIRPYCRKVTVVWCGVFLGHAFVIAGLALFAPLAWWRAYTGWIAWLAMGGVSLVEFAVRKSWFRYYAGGPLDRIWAALLPPENTAQGRRSMEYIRRKRAEMGRSAP